MLDIRALVAGFLCAAIPAIALATDDTAADDQAHPNCFAIRDWQGWKSPQPDQLLLKVRMHDVYLIDLNEQNSLLSAPGMHLVTKVHGSDRVCAPIDLDLSLADLNHFQEHLFIKSIRKLNAEEIAAIKPEFKP